MFCQLGSTVFDAYKSFVSFNDESEAIIVEHLLIGRKPRIEGAALGLRTLTISIFLHAEFCVVDDEVSKLRASKDSYEILPLLWGNGKVEGQFVIQKLTVENSIFDTLGNKYSASVELVLKENANDNQLDQQQQQAQKNAFASGDKKPATKSKRVNPSSCAKQITDIVSGIRANGGVVNSDIQGFNRTPIQVSDIQITCNVIIQDCAQIIAATLNSSSCVYNNNDLSSSANNVRASADQLRLGCGDPSTSVTTVYSENTILQAAINALVKTSSSIAQTAINRG